MAKRKSGIDGIASGDVIHDGRSTSTIDGANGNDESNANSGFGIAVIDPSAVGDAANGGNSGASGTSDATGTATGGGKRGRGRPPGSGNRTGRKPTSKETAVSVAGIEKILYSLHLGASLFFKSESLVLDESECKQLADALANVGQYYFDVQIDPKTMAWISLLGISGSIYGPRILAAVLEKKADKKNEPPIKLAEVAPVTNVQSKGRDPILSESSNPLESPILPNDPLNQQYH